MKRVLIVGLVALVLPAAAFAWDGTYPTGDAAGTSIHIVVVGHLPGRPDTAAELGRPISARSRTAPSSRRLTLNLMPLSTLESNQYCGDQSLACYDPSTETIYAAPDDQLDEPPAKEIVTHEYGHHIANNQHRRTVVGGGLRDEALVVVREHLRQHGRGHGLARATKEPAYSQNPGEAFAESYRVLALTALGLTPSSWEIVSQTFYPDATALQLLQEDITSPWTGPTVRHVHGSFGFGTTRTIGVQTALDGSFIARLHAPTKARFKLELYNQRDARRARQDERAPRDLRRAVADAEGAARSPARGPFTVDVSKP